MADDSKTELYDLLEKVPFAMLITDDAGTMRGRPMDATIDRKRGQIHFLSRRTDAKVEELHQDRDLAATFSDHEHMIYISVSGKGSVSSDPSLIEECWDPGAEAWLSEDRKNGNVAVITLRPTQAEYWDNDKSTLASVYEFAKGYFSDEAPDMGENKKLNL